jgi:DNA-binding transcriptional MerR regulator
LTTIETVLEALKKFDIDEQTLHSWESELGLTIPQDSEGVKDYSSHHINLFRNVKKHLTLGRTLAQIRQLLLLPASETSERTVLKKILDDQTASKLTLEHPVKQPAVRQPEPRETTLEKHTPMIDLTFPENQATSAQQDPSHIVVPSFGRMPSIDLSESESTHQLDSSPVPMRAEQPTPEMTASLKAYASLPQKMGLQDVAIIESEADAGFYHTETPTEIPVEKVNPEKESMIMLIERLVSEKDHLNDKLTETEKLNSHLYNANNLFHRKVKELTSQIATMKDQLKEDVSLKLMDDKAKLHLKLIESEKQLQQQDRELETNRRELAALREKIQLLDRRVKGILDQFNPNEFCGDWTENAELLEVAYDNFGINIEKTRTRRFRISQVPKRTFGNTAIITTQYDYETNALWKRTETLVMTYIAEGRMQGELVAEYFLDGVPVAKNIYTVTCDRTPVNTREEAILAESRG